MLGFDSVEDLLALPSTASLYVDATDRERVHESLHHDGVVRNAEYQLRRRDGKIITVVENARVVRDADGGIVGYEGTLADISERKRAEMQLSAEKEKAQVTLQSIGDAVITVDADGRIEYLNPVAESLTGWETREAAGRPAADVFQTLGESNRQPIASSILRCLSEGRVVELDEPSLLVNRRGQEISIQDSAAPIRDRTGHLIGAVMVFHDVSQERRLQRALTYQATHDALTGLINRREFESRLNEALQSVRLDPALSHVLMYLDLDQFKVVNDTCGHEAGDRLLKQVTSVVQTRIRTSDVLARLGGDEFGVLLVDCTLDTASRIAENLRQAIREFRFVWGDRVMNVGVSIGLAEVNGSLESVAAVMSAADVACYSAKDSGRNRVQTYRQGRAPERHREMQWVSRINRACDEDRLELHVPADRADPRRRRPDPPLRAAAAHARRAGPAGAARRVHPGGRALQPDAGHRPLGRAPGLHPPRPSPRRHDLRAVRAGDQHFRRPRSTTSSSSTSWSPSWAKPTSRPARCASS